MGDAYSKEYHERRVIACAYERQEAKKLIELLSSLGIKAIEETMEKHDVAFITGWNPHGQPASGEENERQNKSLKEILDSLFYHSFDISGYYGASEYSYMVINYVEDAEGFVENMKTAARLYEQASVLIVPRHRYKGRKGQGIPMDLLKEFATDWDYPLYDAPSRYHFPGREGSNVYRQGYAIRNSFRRKWRAK
jgi:hypothetical protein